MKLKKIIIIFAIALIIVSGISLFIGYNLGINNNKTEKNDNYSETNNDYEGNPVEITVDNWKDYIELEDIEETGVDDFGETTGTVHYTIFRFKENVIKSFDVKLKLEYNDGVVLSERQKEQTLNIYTGSDEFKTNYMLHAKNKNNYESKEFDYRCTIDDFEVIKAKGTVYVK